MITNLEKFYHVMGFMDCLQLFAGGAPDPNEAIQKRLYMQEQAIPDIIPNIKDPVVMEEIKKRVSELVHLNLSTEYVNKYLKQKVDLMKMQDLLKKAQFSNIKDIL